MTTWLRDDSDLTSSTGINSIDIGSVRISGTNIGTTGDTDLLSFSANTLTVNASSGLRLVDSNLKCIKSETGATTILLDAASGNLTLSGAVSAQITAATQNSITSIPNLVTIGTIGTGTWQGTAVADSYIASASTWNALVTCTKANILSALNGDLGGSTPIGDSNDTISVGNLTASGTITGDLTGDVTGDVTGDLTGSVTGNVDGVCTSTTKSSTILVTDNENTAERNLITFVANASTSTGYKSLEMDGDLNYDPNTGTLYSPNISISGGIIANITGNITGNVAGNLTGTILTAAQGNITSVGTLSALAVTGDITLGDDLIITGAIKDDDGVICVGFDSEGNIALAPSGIAKATKIEILSMAQVASDVNKFLMLDGDEIKYADGGQIGTFLASHANVTETVQDIVGAMFTSNTETRISATYEDGDGTIDLVVDDMTADTQLTTEQVEDIVGAMFTGNTETRISATYEDGDGTIDLVADAAPITALNSATENELVTVGSTTTELDAETTLTYTANALVVSGANSTIGVLGGTAEDTTGYDLDIYAGNAYGSSQVGGDLFLNAGRSTGNALGGKIYFTSSIKSAAASSTLRSEATVGSLDTYGSLRVNQGDGSTPGEFVCYNRSGDVSHAKLISTGVYSSQAGFAIDGGNGAVKIDDDGVTYATFTSSDKSLFFHSTDAGGDGLKLMTAANGVSTISTVNALGSVASLTLSPDGPLYLNSVGGLLPDVIFCNNPLVIKEAASADTDTATYGQIWVKNEEPNELQFTDDAGNDYNISRPTNTAVWGGSLPRVTSADGNWLCVPTGYQVAHFSLGTTAGAPDTSYTLTTVADDLGAVIWQAAHSIEVTYVKFYFGQGGSTNTTHNVCLMRYDIDPDGDLSNGVEVCAVTTDSNSDDYSQLRASVPSMTSDVKVTTSQVLIAMIYCIDDINAYMSVKCIIGYKENIV